MVNKTTYDKATIKYTISETVSKNQNPHYVNSEWGFVIVRTL